MPTPVLESAIFDPAETLPVAERRALQARRLAETVRRALGVPFYRDALGRAGVSAEAIRSADDVRRLPFTTKDDLRQSYPLGLLAVPRAELARIHGSSGTTGKPTFVAYTRADLDTWSGLVARFLVAGGLRPEHLVHVAFGYGLFTGGFGLHYGIERVGAAVVPAAGGNTPRQVMLIRDLGAEVLVCTPSYALHIAEVARARVPPRRPAAPHRPLRRRALDRGDARHHRARARDPRVQQLRALRGGRPGRLGRVPVPDRHARAGGSLPRRVRRPRHARARSGRRGGRARVHDAHQAGDAGAALPHPRPRRARSARRARAGAPACA